MKSEPRKPNTELACKHWMLYDPPPVLGDIVYCQYCGEYRRVGGGDLRRRKAADAKEYRYAAICQEPGCNFVRKNMEIKPVKIQGDSHSIRTGHVVTVSDPGGKTEITITYDRNTGVPVTES